MALKNSQYDTIMRSYEQKRLRTQDRLRSHYENVYRNIPEIKEIENSISLLSVQQARKLLNGDSQALSSLKKEIHLLTERKAVLLKESGYPAGYLEPEYECADCQDTGYVNNKKCHCFKKAAVDLLYTQSNLNEILKQENFDTFSMKYYSKSHIDSKTGLSSFETMQRALDLCRGFTENFGSHSDNILLYGDTGVGKTFLSHCIAKELIERSYSVIYFTSFELFDIFEKARFEKNADAELMYGHIFDCDLLIIDDLGTELSNAFTVSQLFLCLNERLMRRKSTIISSNLSLESFKEIYTERIFSRISSNYMMLRLTGDDIRIKKKLMSV